MRLSSAPSGFASSRVEWIVFEPVSPQPVEEYGELAGDGDTRSLLCSTSAALHQASPESSQVAVLAEGTEDVVGALDQESAQVSVSRFAHP